jgi:transcriptional regulator with XRE-family HTH domain
MDRDREQFSGVLLRCRARTGLTQRALAARAGVSLRTVQGWEAGLIYPSGARLRALLVALLDAGGLIPNRELAEARQLWEAVALESTRAHPPFEQAWFAEEVARRGKLPALREHAGASPRSDVPIPPTVIRSPDSGRSPREDWGDAPAVVNFVGRSSELAKARDRLVQDRCRVVGVLGMGGHR